jgi:phosphoribosylanthranilate isomerase
MIVQIYEIQTPFEAEKMIARSVGRIGSVVLSEASWKKPSIKETVALVQSAHAVSSMIPLFSKLDNILRVLDFYRPDIVHFCEALTDRTTGDQAIENLIKNHERVKNHFPDIMIMRSIPIVPAGMKKDMIPTLNLARMFEPVSDYFLTDTFLMNQLHTEAGPQPVDGFIGITGRTCDWDIAAKLVAQSSIPVILGGGITPDNAIAGIKRVCPVGIDSCTGTNAVDDRGRPIRFRKDLEKVTALVEAVSKAQQKI